MSQSDLLKEKFFSETGIRAINSWDEPDIDYVAWLENLVKLSKSQDKTSEVKSTGVSNKKLSKYLSDALELCNDGNFDLGYQVINDVINSLNAE